MLLLDVAPRYSYRSFLPPKVMTDPAGQRDGRGPRPSSVGAPNLHSVAARIAEAALAPLPLRRSAGTIAGDEGLASGAAPAAVAHGDGGARGRVDRPLVGSRTALRHRALCRVCRG